MRLEQFLKRDGLWFGTFIVFLILIAGKYFFNVSDPSWFFAGDTVNNFNFNYYQYSGFSRGEYPYWNPLIRTGQPATTTQIIQLAAPLNNIPLFFLSLFGVKDMVLVSVIPVAAYIAAYVGGVYALMLNLTQEHKTAAFSAILATISSPVIFSSFHISFVMIVHAVPWMILGVVGYFNSYKLAYLVMTCVAGVSFLYSYEFVLGLVFLCLVTICYLIFGGAREVPRLIKGIPGTHYLLAIVLACVAVAPMVFLYFDFLETIRFTMAVGLKITDEFLLDYTYKPSVRFIDYILHPKLWITLFSGANFTSYQELRQVIGPLAPALIAPALFLAGSGRATKIIGLAGILVTAVHFYPLNLLFKVFPFTFIHNASFLYQYFIFAAIVVAGVGFSRLEDGKFRQWFVWLNLFLLICLSGFLAAQFVFNFFDRAHNVIILSAGFAAVGAFVISAWKMSGETTKSAVVVISVLFGILASVLYDRLPISGEKIESAAYDEIRYPKDFDLKYDSKRPDDIQRLKLPKKLWDTELYDSNGNEYSSNITLTDNTYGKFSTMRIGTLPHQKDWVLFVHLKGHENFIRQKFHLFDKFATSTDKSDMQRFLEDPDLLGAMLDREVVLIDRDPGHATNLGKFDPTKIRQLPVPQARRTVNIGNVKFMANSIRFSVSLGQPGILAYTDLWKPGWSARVNGRAVSVNKVFHTYKGISLPAGSHVVEFSYFSWSIVSIVFMNIVFLIGAMGLIVFAAREILSIRARVFEK